MMRTPLSLPASVENASAWRADDLRANRFWEWRVSDAQRIELVGAVAAVRAKNLRAAEFGRNDFPLPVVGPMLARAQHDLENGHGVVLLRGLPVDPNEEED